MGAKNLRSLPVVVARPLRRAGVGGEFEIYYLIIFKV